MKICMYMYIHVCNVHKLPCKGWPCARHANTFSGNGAEVKALIVLRDLCCVVDREHFWVNVCREGGGEGGKEGGRGGREREGGEREWKDGRRKVRREREGDQACSPYVVRNDMKLSTPSSPPPLPLLSPSLPHPQTHSQCPHSSAQQSPGLRLPLPHTHTDALHWY